MKKIGSRLRIPGIVLDDTGSEIEVKINPLVNQNLSGEIKQNDSGEIRLSDGIEQIVLDETCIETSSNTSSRCSNKRKSSNRKFTRRSIAIKKKSIIQVVQDVEMTTILTDDTVKETTAKSRATSKS